MRRSLFALTLVVAATPVFAARPQAARASCAAVIVWHDTAYFGYSTSGARPHSAPGPRVRGTVQPACNDTGGGAGSPTPVNARAFAGVPPQVALLWNGGIYVPAGEFPQLSGFPIRFGLVDDETRTCRVTAHVTVSGHVLPAPGEVDLADVRSTRPLRLFDHRLSVLVDVHTRIAGLDRNGVPYIGRLQAVRIDALRCGHMIVATRVVPAGPIALAATAEDVLGPHWRGGPGLVSDLHDRTLLMAVALTAVGMAAVIAVRRRRPPAARR
jgi:hypothetical protein